jgi:hypothetical protein
LMLIARQLRPSSLLKKTYLRATNGLQAGGICG